MSGQYPKDEVNALYCNQQGLECRVPALERTQDCDSRLAAACTKEIKDRNLQCLDCVATSQQPEPGTRMLLLSSAPRRVMKWFGS